MYDAQDARRPVKYRLAKVAFDRRGAVKRQADRDRRRCGFGGFRLLHDVRAVLAGIQLGAERVERRGKRLRISLEKKKERHAGRDQGNDQPIGACGYPRDVSPEPASSATLGDSATQRNPCRCIRLIHYCHLY